MSKERSHKGPCVDHRSRSYRWPGDWDNWLAFVVASVNAKERSANSGGGARDGSFAIRASKVQLARITATPAATLCRAVALTSPRTGQHVAHKPRLLFIVERSVERARCVQFRRWGEPERKFRFRSADGCEVERKWKKGEI